MKNLILSILLLLPAYGFSQRDTLGILNRSSLLDAESEYPTAIFYTSSPTAMLHHPQASLSQLALRMDLRREEQARLQPLGDGALDGGFYAQSYQRFNDRSVVWADARYVRGNRSNICWNSTADYLLLYPYITADSVSGDLSTEEYAFGGGYAHRLGRAVLALRGDYRASQEYRQVDPRPHNVVSDFMLKISAGIESSSYVFGFDLHGRLYKQNQKITFYNPANIREFFMTGLGAYFQRYTGKGGNTQVAFNGKEYGMALYLIPQHKNGWYARASFRQLTTNRNYVPNNSIPVSGLKTQQATAAVAYRADRWSLKAGADYELRRGIEMVADRNGQGEIVDQQAMYQNRVWCLNSEATVEWHHSAIRYTLQPRVEWWHSSASYVYPERLMEISRMGGAVRGNAEWFRKRWRIKATVGIGYFLSPQEKLTLNGLATYLSDYLSDTARNMSTSAFALEAALRTEHQMPNRLACFIEAGWKPRFYDGGAVEQNLTVACGLLF